MSKPVSHTEALIAWIEDATETLLNGQQCTVDQCRAFCAAPTSKRPGALRLGYTAYLELFEQEYRKIMRDPAPPASHGPAALQLWREVRAGREENMQRYLGEHADAITRALLFVQQQRRKPRPKRESLAEASLRAVTGSAA